MDLITALPFLILSNLVAGFVFGKFHERVEWNNKIKSGAIPVPKK